MPDIVWSKDSEELQHGGRVYIDDTLTHTMLVIHEVSKADGGLYSLVVENDLGSDMVSFPIQVAGSFEGHFHEIFQFLKLFFVDFLIFSFLKLFGTQF